MPHFSNLPAEFWIPTWGRPFLTTDLPWSYVPGELLARLPEGFIVLMVAALARSRGLLIVAMAGTAPLVIAIVLRAANPSAGFISPFGREFRRTVQIDRSASVPSRHF